MSGVANERNESGTSQNTTIACPVSALYNEALYAENDQRDQSQTGKVNRVAQLRTEICCKREFASLTSWNERRGIPKG